MRECNSTMLSKNLCQSSYVPAILRMSTLSRSLYHHTSKKLQNISEEGKASEKAWRSKDMDYDALHQFIATGILLHAIAGSRLKFRRLSILTPVEYFHILPLVRNPFVHLEYLRLHDGDKINTALMFYLNMSSYLRIQICKT